MKRILLVTLAFCSLAASAQIYETVYTSDGSEYEGYISEQIPGKSISVYAEKATLRIPLAKISNRRVEERAVSSLPCSAQEFFKGRGDSIYVPLCSFDLDKVPYDNLYVLNENDHDSMVVISFSQRTYRLAWATVQKTKKLTQDTIPYGILDIILLKTGERYEGWIMENQLGSGLVVKTKADGILHTISNSDIISIRSEKIADASLFEQTQLKDRVILKDGTSLTGFITSRVFGQKIKILLPGDMEEHSVELKDIERYQKTWNHEYIAYVEPVDTLQWVSVNKREAEMVEAFIKKGVVYLPDSVITEVKSKKTIRILLHNYELEGPFALYSIKSAKLKGDDGMEYHYLSYDESASVVKECTAMTNDNGDVLSTFKIQKAGLYALQLDEEKYLVIRVEE